MAQLKKAYYAGYEECEKGDANCFTGWREWASQLQSPMRWETLARIEENKSVLSMAERHMDERACVVIKQRIFNLEQQLDESQEEGLCDAKPIGYEKLLMPESTQEEYAAQSNGIRWEYPQKPELANKALNRCYPEREGTFGSTFTDGYMQCMRDIEDGILPLPESTQEGGTVGEANMETIIQNHLGILAYKIPSNEPIRKAMTEYASQVSATDKKRISELEKEVLDLKEINKLLSDGITEKIRNEALSKYTEWKEDFCKRKNICPVCVTGGYECTSDHK